MKTTIFHSYGKWYLSGVNTWTANLIRAMRDTEFDSKVLFTGIPREPQPELDELEIPYDFLNVPLPRNRRKEWQALKEFLESHAPCIYIANFDFHRSCAVGTLFPEVRVVTVIHSDEECYFDELRRVGQNCDAIVCVSRYLTAKVKQRFPHLASRVHLIPYGIPVPEGAPPSRPIEGPLRLCYCNRLQQYQKRIFDLPLIAVELEKLGVDYELDIAGDGPDADELRRRFDRTNLKCPVRFHGRVTNTAVIDLCRSSHLFLLTSDFEGLPISLLEAMSVGCVPVVYDIESGISDAIPNKKFGCVIPHADVNQFAYAVKKLSEDRCEYHYLETHTALQIENNFSLSQMLQKYKICFTEILNGPNQARDFKIRVPFELSTKGRIMKKLSSFMVRYKIKK